MEYAESVSIRALSGQSDESVVVVRRINLISLEREKRNRSVAEASGAYYNAISEMSEIMLTYGGIDGLASHQKQSTGGLGLSKRVHTGETAQVV